MNVILLLTALVGIGVEPESDDVKKLLKSEDFTVTWEKAPSFDSSAELEIGDSSFHFVGSMLWLRFKPAKDHVDVLWIEKFFPPLTVKSAVMKLDDYASLLNKLAIVEAAKLKPAGKWYQSSHNFWVHCRLSESKKILVDQHWSGYAGGGRTVEYAKPQAAVELARASIKLLEFKKHSLTEEERSWASAKFIRDWSAFEEKDKEKDEDHRYYGNISGFYLETIGFVANKSILAKLREIIASDPKDYSIVPAIDSALLLLNKDVLKKPVEDKDVEKARKMALELLRDVK